MNTTSVTNPGARPPVDGNTGSPNASSASVETASLMPEPSQCDVSMAIAQLVIQNAFNSRTAARQDRQRATENMIAAQKAQVAELRKQADQKFAASALDAVGKMVQGGASVAGGAIAAGGAKEVGAAVKGGGEHDAGVCGLGSAFLNHEADLSSARAKSAEMEATRQKEAIDGANDEMNEARQHIRTALDFLREFKSTEAQTMSAAIRA